jgi:glycosyltransferase involved in cell wall biosynthesis
VRSRELKLREGGNKTAMRIAIFSEVHGPMVSGVAVTLRRLVTALEERGHAVRVYTATYPEDTAGPERVHRSRSVRFVLDPKIQWAFPRRSEVIADLRAFAPDVVHVMTEFAIGLTGIRAARALGVPVVASAHTDYDQYASLYRVGWVLRPGWHYLRWFYRQAEVVLCPSRGYEEHLNRRGVRHTGLWTRGVDPSEFSPLRRSEAFRASFGADAEGVLVAYVGRFGPEKRIETLLDAWKDVAVRHPSASLLFVGQGLMEESIRQRALPRVHMAGVLHGEKLAQAYASADVLAFPSDTETFGNVLLEAMSSGIASVTAAAGGVLDFARDGENSLLVPPRDPQAMAEALGRLISDYELRSRLAAGARQTALNRRWDTIYDQLIAEYSRIAAAERGAGKLAS